MAPSLERCVDDRLATFRRSDAVGVGDSLASSANDLLRGCAGGIASGAITRHQATKIVHNDKRSERLRRSSAYSPPSPCRCRYDGDLLIETCLVPHIGELSIRVGYRSTTARGSRRSAVVDSRVKNQGDVAQAAIGSGDPLSKARC